MTREEAIKIIKECREKGFKYTFYTVNEYYSALDMAIKALRCEDTLLGNVLEIINAEHDSVTNTMNIDKEYVSVYTVINEIRAEVEELKEGEQE